MTIVDGLVPQYLAAARETMDAEAAVGTPTSAVASVRPLAWWMCGDVTRPGVGGDAATP